MEKEDLYHPLILERNKNPLFFEKGSSEFIHAYNPVCGDEFRIYPQWENDLLENVSFFGYGCAVSKAALDMILERFRKKSTAQIREELDLFLNMLEGGSLPPGFNEINYPPMVFSVVQNYPARFECAALGAKAFLMDLKQKG